MSNDGGENSTVVNCLCYSSSIFEKSVRAPRARQTTKLVGESHPDSYLGVFVCSTNNAKDCKYVW